MTDEERAGWRKERSKYERERARDAVWAQIEAIRLMMKGTCYSLEELESELSVAPAAPTNRQAKDAEKSRVERESLRLTNTLTAIRDLTFSIRVLARKRKLDIDEAVERLREYAMRPVYEDEDEPAEGEKS